MMRHPLVVLLLAAAAALAAACSSPDPLAECIDRCMHARVPYPAAACIDLCERAGDGVDRAGAGGGE